MPRLAARFGRRLLIVLPVVLCALFRPVLANDLQAKVQAAYVFHLTRFVDWPALPESEIRICVVGADTLAGLITELSGREVKDRSLRVMVDLVPDPAICQVLFIGPGERHAAELLARVRGRPVLTVSDEAEFARHGGMVGFYMEGGKLRLEVNPELARTVNLRFSAKLLEVARSVTKP